MAGGVDRLSDLPDELLLRVLHFVPGKQAAATTALSRRWRSPLWRSSGAVNLETYVEDWGYYTHIFNDSGGEWDDRLFLSRRDAFVSAAEAALDAADVPVTRLTLRVTGHNCIDLFLNGHWDVNLPSPWSPHQGALAKLLSHRAARRVEELRLDVYNVYSDDQTSSLSSLGLDVLNLGSVQSENLRVLDLTNCRELVPPASAVVFPRLSSLRLHHGTVRLDALQSLIYAAPALITVHFESLIISPPTDGVPDYSLPNQSIYRQWKAYAPPLPPAQALLRLPVVTMLVLDGCNWKDKDVSRRDYIADKAGVVPVEIHAPRLRWFSYKGLLRPFSLSPLPPDLAHADLHFVPRARDDRVNKTLPEHKETNEDPCRGEASLKTFWRFLHNFTSVKELKLNVNHLEDMAVLTEARRAELLPTFSILKRLDLHRVHMPQGKTATVAIADLLRCCPTLRSLRINHTAVHQCTTTPWLLKKCLLMEETRSCGST
ncbi:hypothetical protein CFC21_043864 [Triticum aestivum]|uniref:F-box domain-containing protein n=2 Tax=Triticum aestivum TaxID=4565 RepID=A0A9R1FQN5_WHEAT|nr:hypothetical protein CFC21_043864 [Triticum aestivum]CDM82868.1 unnamed protein product [Triticum aestivum]